jgi:osmotically inducible protein OsmC
MAFSARLEKAGYQPRRVETKANVSLDKSDGGFSISQIELVTEAEVPDLENEEFQKLAEDAKSSCPVSKALKGTKIVLNATLAGSTGRKK